MIDKVDKRDLLYIEGRLIVLEHLLFEEIPQMLADAEQELAEAEDNWAKEKLKLRYPEHVKTLDEKQAFACGELPHLREAVVLAQNKYTYHKHRARGAEKEFDSLRSRLSFAKTELTGRK